MSESDLTDIRRHITKSLSWSSTYQLTSKALQFTIQVILARLLSPEEFGLIDMVEVFAGFTRLFTEMGLNDAIIHRQKIEHRLLCSIFWIEIIIGFLLTCLVACASPLIARFYHQPALQPLVTLISLSFFTNSLHGVQRALFYKYLNLRMLTIIQTSSVFGAGIIAIILAFTGYGVWSLAWQSVTLALLTTIGMWAASDWRPSLQFNISDIREVAGFGFNLLGFNIFNYWTMNVDNLLIGRYLGSSALGIYSRAYQIMLLARNQISSIFNRVMFPVLSSIQQEKARIKKIYLKMIRYISLITFPLMLGLLAVTKSFVLTVYGPRWEGIIPILRVFCIVGLAHSISMTTNWIYLSQGRTDRMFQWGICEGIVKSLGIVIGLRYGIFGIAVGYVTASVVFLLYPEYVIVGKLINMTFKEVVNALANTFCCAAIMAILVYALSPLIPPDWPPWAYLGVQVFFGAGAYLATLHVFRIQAYQEVKALLAEHWYTRRPPVAKLPIEDELKN